MFGNFAFNSLFFESLGGVILICLAGYQFLNSVKYTRSILQNGTKNGFSLAAIAYSYFFSLILLTMGIMAMTHLF